jgi:hypothetical protein
LQVIPFHPLLSTIRELEVHVIPLVELAATCGLREAVAKIPVFGLTATASQYPLTGKVRWVHVIPFVEEAAMLVLKETATKTPVAELQVTADQPVLTGKVRWVHVIPSVEEAAIDEP